VALLCLCHFLPFIFQSLHHLSTNGFIDTSLQLQSIITAHNQWVSRTRSIPYWTTSVFSSTATNDERRITESLDSLTNEQNWLPGEPNMDHHLKLLLCYLFYPLPQKHACPTVAQQMYYSMSMHCLGNVLTESTSTLAPLFRLSGVISQYVEPISVVDSALVSCSGGARFESRSADQFSWFTSVLIGRCRDSISN
jgi:hypothetical protein